MRDIGILKLLNNGLLECARGSKNRLWARGAHRITSPPLLAIAEGRRARPRKSAVPPPKELDLHLAVADALRRFARPDWRWSHFPSGEHRDKRTAAKLKAMGVQRGWPDFVLFDPSGRLYALELKRRGENLTEDQKAFRVWCHESSIQYVVAVCVDGALAELSRWGVLRIKIKDAQ
jgi:hypothetical protein